VSGRIFQDLRRLIELRKQQPALANSEMDVMSTGNDHVFGYVRHHLGQRLVALANFTEREQVILANEVRLYGLGYTFTDLVSDQAINLAQDLRLEPYQFVWLVAN